jgi:hypothetical protein
MKIPAFWDLSRYASVVPSVPIFVTLMMEALSSSEIFFITLQDQAVLILNRERERGYVNWSVGNRRQGATLAGNKHHTQRDRHPQQETPNTTTLITSCTTPQRRNSVSTRIATRVPWARPERKGVTSGLQPPPPDSRVTRTWGLSHHCH